MSKEPSKLLKRIAAEAGVPELDAALSRLSPSDLNSLLLHVFGQRAVNEADLMRATAALLAPSAVDARRMHEFDTAAFEAAADFDALELSPVSPLGLSRVLGGIHQNNVLSALRGSEVSGDPTSVLAIECARRRKRGFAVVNLCASQRVIRLQPFDHPGYSPHFRLFGLATAGRDTGSFGFEIDALGRHIRCYLDLFRRLSQRGFQFDSPLVELSDTRVMLEYLASHGLVWEEVRESIRAHNLGGSERFFAERGVAPPADDDLLPSLLEDLRREFPEAEFRCNHARLEGVGYYSGLCLRISPLAPDGVRYPIVDGGFTDWTARLLQNRKERLLATGVGSQFAAMKY